MAANGPHKTNQVKVGGSFYNPQHDANGNRNLTFANGTLTGEASCDREDRVASISLGGGESVSFVYDAGGQQKIKIFTEGTGSEVTRYYTPQIEVRPDGSTIKSYYFGGTRVASVVESGSGWQTAASQTRSLRSRRGPGGVGPWQAIVLVDLLSISAPILDLSGAISAPKTPEREP